MGSKIDAKKHMKFGSELNEKSEVLEGQEPSTTLGFYRLFMISCFCKKYEKIKNLGSKMVLNNLHAVFPH